VSPLVCSWITAARCGTADDEVSAGVRDESVTGRFDIERNLGNESAALRPRFVQRRNHRLARGWKVAFGVVHVEKRAGQLIGKVSDPLIPANDDAESSVGRVNRSVLDEIVRTQPCHRAGRNRPGAQEDLECYKREPASHVVGTVQREWS
jgi:hypothetical protein